MIVLGLTTATARGGAALLRAGELLGESCYEDEMKHAERIFGALDAALERAGLGRGAIEAVACDIGPGSFTGVRVGLASAKGIAVALGVPLVGVCSLEAMAAAAFAAAPAVEILCTLLDAKRGEVFAAAYRRDGAIVRPPAHLEAARALEAFEDLRRQGLLFAGRKAAELGVPAEQRVAHEACELPHPAWIAREGARRLAAGEISEIGALEPLYLRAPDATPPKS